MARSMTGFGRAKVENQGLGFTVEIKTLNHRYLDINIRLPKVISFLEEDLRKRIQDRLREVGLRYTYRDHLKPTTKSKYN